MARTDVKFKNNAVIDCFIHFKDDKNNPKASQILLDKKRQC